MNLLSEIDSISARIAQLDGASAGSSQAVAPAADDVTSFQALLDQGVLSDAIEVPYASPPGGAAIVAPARVDELVRQSAAAYGVDPSLVKAVIANESGFDASATSSTGAQGLMQLMPETAASLGVGNAYDPAQNIAGGTRYLAGLLQRFGGNVQLAVAAYNAGPGAVERYGGVPPYTETQNYVAGVMASYARYRA